MLARPTVADGFRDTKFTPLIVSMAPKLLGALEDENAEKVTTGTSNVKATLLVVTMALAGPSLMPSPSPLRPCVSTPTSEHIKDEAEVHDVVLHWVIKLPRLLPTFCAYAAGVESMPPESKDRPVMVTQPPVPLLGKLTGMTAVTCWASAPDESSATARTAARPAGAHRRSCHAKWCA